jgi:hypothetical protein
MGILRRMPPQGGATIIDFAKAAHARSFAAGADRAAKATSFSAVKPESLAVIVRRMALHHSSGMRSRCHHLRTADAPAPISAAKASCEAHSKMTARKESILGIESSLGQLVLKRKANMSRDRREPLSDNARMVSKVSETEEKFAFIERVKLARETRYSTQREMLILLGVDQGTYKQYETRTLLPHRFIPKFCAATGVSIEWLLTGEGKGPALTMPAEPRRRTRKARKAA